ncbi:hypothetical protein BJ944DRAFT_258760 [Cunninghamella echinulata]|nr:hypothetical protein BJ944DRAFT_258760 [Cunninghamella echinulata]
MTIDKHNPILLPSTMRVSVLLRRIGLERSWTQEQINGDLEILNKNRIYTVRDLLSLSDYSWKSIELLPLVKDLLRAAVDPEWSNTENEPKKKKNEKKKFKSTKPIPSIGSPVYPGKLDDNNDIFKPTLNRSSSFSTFSTNSSSTNPSKLYTNDKLSRSPSSTVDENDIDGRKKIDECDPILNDMVCDDPITIRNTLKNLKADFLDEDMKPISPPNRSNSCKNVRFNDRNSIISNNPILSTTSSTNSSLISPTKISSPFPISFQRKQSDSDSSITSSVDTVPTDEDEEALMTAAASMVTSRTGNRLRKSTISPPKNHFTNTATNTATTTII